ncbi:MAG TPA: hypothetical protein PLK12_18090 [Prolixibacteraceae bacterium]|nr:hypothetical protein [Prolixibacteraceae bacterium]
MLDFSNHYNATIDDKGRIVLPSAYKKKMVESSERIVFVELDPIFECLNLYPPSSWEERVRTVKARLNPNDPRQSRLLDRFFQGFVEITISENGRLNIPNTFYQRKGIVKNAVFSGQGDRVRLWDTGRFQAHSMTDEEFSADFAAMMGGNIDP